MLFYRSFRKSLIFFPFAALAVYGASHLWAEVPLISAPPEMGFCDLYEPLLPLLLLPPLSLMLHDPREIELSLTCGTSILRLAAAKALPFFVYTLGSAYSVLALTPYDRYGWQETGRRIIPLFIPEEYRLLLLVSAAVTLLFFFSLFLFLRVLTRNCYAPLCLGLLIYYAFYNLNVSIRGGTADIRRSFFDPFLCNYFLGDTVPAEYYGAGNLWTNNRLLFLGSALLLLTAACLLLKREKLHRGFNN